MKYPRFYQAIDYIAGAEVELSESVANHISRVLRLRVGQLITLFDGQNQQCDAEIIDIEKRRVVVKLAGPLFISRESDLQITLVQALSKGDRFDWVVQKAVELGVSKLIPITSERNVVKLDAKRQQKKISHWQGIIESASEQCGRNQLMQLADITSLDGYLKEKGQQPHIVLSPYSEQRLTSINNISNQVTFLVGPEGGFSDKEIAAMQAAGVQAVQLGPRVLRTETAAISICAISQTLWGS